MSWASNIPMAKTATISSDRNARRESFPSFSSSLKAPRQRIESLKECHFVESAIKFTKKGLGKLKSIKLVKKESKAQLAARRCREEAIRATQERLAEERQARLAAERQGHLEAEIRESRRARIEGEREALLSRIEDEIVQPRKVSGAMDFSPPNNEVRRRNAKHLSEHAAHLKRKRMSLNKKIRLKDGDFKHLSMNIIPIIPV